MFLNILQCIKNRRICFGMNAVQSEIQKQVVAKLGELRVKNPSFSLRAFSRRLGISPATLSLVASGRRRISRRLAVRILERLGLDPGRTSSIMSMFQEGAAAPLTGQAMQLTMDQFHVVSEWYHFAIRALLRTRNAKSSPVWIAARLGIKESEAGAAIARLLRLEMLVRGRGGKLVPTETSYHTPDGVSDSSIRRNHAKHLELALMSLDSDPVGVRDFTNLTMAVAPSGLEEARRAIRRFRKEISAILEHTDAYPKDCDEVYNLSIQLFPLSRANGTKTGR